MKRVFIFIVLAGLLGTCKKYPEDEKSYLLCKPECRLTRDWKFDRFLINGIDSTNSVSACLLTSRKVSFSKFLYIHHFRVDNGNCFDGGWFFEEKKNKLKITKVNGYSKPFMIKINSEGGTEWTVLKLTKTEMKIQLIDNNNEYIIILKQ